MKILVLGASRGTGLHAAKLAVEGGHQVTAVARNILPIEQMKMQLPVELQKNLDVVKGDVLVPSSINGVMPGQDVVISSIGVTSREPTTLYSRGIENIMDAMQKHQVSRLICVSAVGLEVTPAMSLLLKALIRFIVQPFLKNNFADLSKMEEAVKQRSLNWTIVRAPRLANGDVTGRYRFAANEYLRNPLILRRADLAHFIVGNLTNEKIHRARVEVAE